VLRLCATATCMPQPPAPATMPPHLSQPLGFCTKESFEAMHLGLSTGSAALSLHGDKTQLLKVGSSWKIGSSGIASLHRISLRPCQSGSSTGRGERRRQRSSSNKGGCFKGCLRTCTVFGRSDLSHVVEVHHLLFALSLLELLLL